MCRALELPLTSYFRLRIDPAAFAVLRFNARGGTTLEVLNERCHLQGLTEQSS